MGIELADNKNMIMIWYRCPIWSKNLSNEGAPPSRLPSGRSGRNEVRAPSLELGEHRRIFTKSPILQWKIINMNCHMNIVFVLKVVQIFIHIKEIRKCNGYVFMARLEYIRIDCTISPDTIIVVLHRYCNLFIWSIMSLSAHRLTRVIFNYLEWEINAIFNAENT